MLVHGDQCLPNKGCLPDTAAAHTNPNTTYPHFRRIAALLRREGWRVGNRYLVKNEPRIISRRVIKTAAAKIIL
jgi:hypothetical protein